MWGDLCNGCYKMEYICKKVFECLNMNRIDFDLLSQCPLFKGVTPDGLRVLFESLFFQVRRYEAGDLIASSGEEVRSLSIVLLGSVRGEMGDIDGKTIKIEDIEAPRPLAVAFLFGNAAFFPVHIVANETVELLSIPKDEVVKLLQMNTLILNRFMDNISSRAQFLSEKLHFLSFQSLKGKLAHYLLALSNGREGEVVLPKTQEELAVVMGVTRPSLGRALRELNDQGLVDSRAKTIRILNAKGLAALIRS